MPEAPAFEIHSGNRVVLIYANGRVEYLASDRRLPRNASIFINRIPQLIAKAVAGAVGERAA